MGRRPTAPHPWRAAARLALVRLAGVPRGPDGREPRLGPEPHPERCDADLDLNFASAQESRSVCASRVARRPLWVSKASPSSGPGDGPGSHRAYAGKAGGEGPRVPAANGSAATEPLASASGKAAGEAVPLPQRVEGAPGDATPPAWAPRFLGPPARHGLGEAVEAGRLADAARGAPCDGEWTTVPSTPSRGIPR